MQNDKPTPKTSAAKLRANKRYNDKTRKQYAFVLNRNTEADLIAWLEKKDNIMGYIKGLIRKDMGQ